MQPVEPNFHDLIANCLNGSVNEEFIMVKLGVQVIAILITGLVLWRISSIFNKNKRRQRKTVFMGSRFQDKWKNKE